MKKKTMLAVLAVLFTVIIAAGLYDHYFAFKPDMHFVISENTETKDFHLQIITLMLGTDENRPMPQDFEDNLIAFMDWNNAIITDLYEAYIQPIDIYAYGEIKDGKVIFRYAGTVTSQDGEKLDYKEEATFDFGIIPELVGFE